VLTLLTAALGVLSEFFTALGCSGLLENTEEPGYCSTLGSGVGELSLIIVPPLIVLAFAAVARRWLDVSWLITVGTTILGAQIIFILVVS